MTEDFVTTRLRIAVVSDLIGHSSQSCLMRVSEQSAGAQGLFVAELSQQSERAVSKSHARTLPRNEQ